MARRALVVQQRTIGHRDLAGRTVDRKPASCTIRETIGLRITTVGVRPAHGPHHGPVRRILRHRVGRQTQVRRGFVHARDGHRNGLGRSSSFTIRYLNGYIVDVVSPTVGWRFVIGSRHKGQGSGCTINREFGRIGTTGDRIGQRLACIGIGGRHRGYDRGIFRDRYSSCRATAVAGNHGDRFIDVCQVDGEGFAISQSSAVRHFDDHGVARRILIIQ